LDNLPLTSISLDLASSLDLLLAAAEEFGYRGVGRVDMWLHGGSGDMVVMVVTVVVVVLVSIRAMGQGSKS